MQRIALTVLGLGLALAQFAHADNWSKTYTIAAKPSLRSETSDGNIHVDTWDQNSIEARVATEHYKIGAGGIKIVEHQSGDTVELEVRLPHQNNFGFNRSYRVDINIHIPREGRVSLHTGDGSIRLANFKGEMELQSGDGHQDIDSVDGSLRARAGDGHIRASGRFDGLEMTTGDGRIDARVLSGSTIASGWELRAGDGSITLQLPDKFSADIDLRTGDGHITTDVPMSVEGSLDKKEIRGKLNGGGNQLTIGTGDGSIRLEKS
jgi:Putative adhesin